MIFLHSCKSNKYRDSSSVAKERLKKLVAYERLGRSGHNFLPAIQQDIMKVVEKYFQVTNNNVSVRLDNAGDFSTLEVNVQLAENS